jgi:hypothetical protein
MKVQSRSASIMLTDLAVYINFREIITEHVLAYCAERAAVA